MPFKWNELDVTVIILTLKTYKMKPKKSSKADLEKKKGIFIQIGLIVAMSITLIAFEWTTLPETGEDFSVVSSITFEDEIIATQQEESTPEQPEPEVPEVAEVLDIVDDDVAVPDFNFENEVDGNTTIDIKFYDDGPEEKIEDDDTPFVRVEEMPLFNGGKPEVEFWKYISKNLEYPNIAQENGVGGKVHVQFIVDEKGNVVDAKVLVPIDPALDSEALRVVNSSPQWTPGRQRGKAVKVIYTFPIIFKLQ